MLSKHYEIVDLQFDERVEAEGKFDQDSDDDSEFEDHYLSQSKNYSD